MVSPTLSPSTLAVPRDVVLDAYDFMLADQLVTDRLEAVPEMRTAMLQIVDGGPLYRHASARQDDMAMARRISVAQTLLQVQQLGIRATRPAARMRGAPAFDTPALTPTAVFTAAARVELGLWQASHGTAAGQRDASPQSRTALTYLAAAHPALIDFSQSPHRVPAAVEHDLLHKLATMSERQVLSGQLMQGFRKAGIPQDDLLQAQARGLDTVADQYLEHAGRDATSQTEQPALPGDTNAMIARGSRTLTVDDAPWFVLDRALAVRVATAPAAGTVTTPSPASALATLTRPARRVLR